ncbi:hypothetical protein KUCAC02_001351, partial [Chaenocephalus aceratus]
ALHNQSVGRVAPQAVKPRHSARAMLNTRHLDPPLQSTGLFYRQPSRDSDSKDSQVLMVGRGVDGGWMSVEEGGFCFVYPEVSALRLSLRVPANASKTQLASVGKPGSRVIHFALWLATKRTAFPVLHATLRLSLRGVGVKVQHVEELFSGLT